MREDRISYRQMKRMIILEGVGAAGLSFPAIAAQGSESEGLLPILSYVVLLSFLFWYLCKASRWVSEKESVILNAIYRVRFLINAGTILLFFCESIRTIYLPEFSRAKIALPLVILLWYLSQTTLQKRARFLELIFPWIVVCFFLIIVLALWGMEGNWHGIVPRDAPKITLENGYVLLLCSTPLEFLLLLFPAASNSLWEPEKASYFVETKKEAAKGIWGILLGNILLWFVTIEMLGGFLTQDSRWPVAKMIQLIRLPGAFMNRFDLILVVFWIFGIMGVVTGYLFYGKMMMRSREQGLWKEGWIDAVFLFGIYWFLSVADVKTMEELFLFYKRWIDFPLLLLLPILAKCVGKKKVSKVVLAGLLTVCLGILSGCGGVSDVEDCSYVLSMYVDHDGKEYHCRLAMADLEKLETSKKEMPCRMLNLSGKDLKEMEDKKIEQESGTVEWNHIYSIFLGENVWSNPQILQDFLQEWDDDWEKSPDVVILGTHETAERLYGAKEIPKGAAGQEAALILEEMKMKRNQYRPIALRKQIAEGKEAIWIPEVKIQENRLMIKNQMRVLLKMESKKKARAEKKARNKGSSGKY